MIEKFKTAKEYNNREALIAHCLSLAKKNGFFLEFGVFKGTSINFMSKQCPHQIFYGFDSFEGLPEDWVKSDIKSVNSTRPKGHFSLPELPKVNSNVRLIKGFFDESLPRWIKANLTRESTMSFLHIDSDLYSSAKTILTELNDYIKPGTIIAFDELCDWQNSKIYPNWRDGEWKALNEWVEEYGRKYEVVGRAREYEGAINVTT